VSFKINTNVMALHAKVQLSMNNRALDESVRGLSSGLRIQTSSDDVAGLSIANRLSAQSNGLGQAIRNANDGIGLVQTADGALEEYANILNRIRTLAVSGANDTQDSASRAHIGKEMVRLQSELNHIANETKYNGKLLLAGEDGPTSALTFGFGGGFGGGGGTTESSATFLFHVGAYKDEVTRVEIDDMNTDKVLANQIEGLSTQGSAEVIISMMDSALNMVANLRASLGAAQNQLQSSVRNVSVSQINISASQSLIEDVDFALESTNFSKSNILAQSSSYALQQANVVQQRVVKLLE
jgi:flagellin